MQVEHILRNIVKNEVLKDRRLLTLQLSSAKMGEHGNEKGTKADIYHLFYD